MGQSTPVRAPTARTPGSGSRKRRHIVVCGCSRGGTTLLYNMLRSTLVGATCPPQERPALKYIFNRSPLLVTKRPLDILSAGEIIRKLKPFKAVDFVIVIRDPRALVSSRHSSAPDQPFQGFDYQMWVGKTASAYVKPGVLAVYDAIDALTSADGVSSVVVRYEDLVSDPDKVQADLSRSLDLEMAGRFQDFHRAEIPADLTRALNGVRPVEAANAESWRTGARLQRVCEQFRRAPDMLSILTRWGYEADDAWLDLACGREPGFTAGTIVAMAPESETTGAAIDRLKTSIGAWNAGGAFKSVTCGTADGLDRLIDARRALRGPLLCVTPDAIFRADPWPYVAEVSADLGAFVDSQGGFHAETLVLNDTPGAEQALTLWRDTCRGGVGSWSDGLEQLVAASASPRDRTFSFHRLPVNLCWLPHVREPYVHGAPVIEHTRRLDRPGAARRLLGAFDRYRPA